MKSILIQGAGWYGMCAVLIAYTLFSLSMIESQSLIYQLLTLTGWVGIAIQALYKKAYPASLLALVWALIAVYSLWVFFVR